MPIEWLIDGIRFEQDETFAQPLNSTLSSSEAAAPTGSLAVAAAPTGGQGLALNELGQVPIITLISPFRSFIDQDTTPSVAGGILFQTVNTAATTITTFDDAAPGQRITVLFTDANTTVSDAGNLRLSAAFTSTADDTLELIFDGTNWYELGRSAN